MNGSADRAWPVPFRFGGRPCLDFVNTLNSRSRPATRDYLPDWEALAGWCRQTALFETEVMMRLEDAGARNGEGANAAHRQAITFRETLYGIFKALIDDEAAPGMSLDVLNENLRAARHRQVLAGAGRGFDWRWDVSRLDLAAPVHAVALSAGAMLSQDDLGRLKECPGPDGCGWLFFDETRNGSRRWCSMDHCGGAAKARRYAARHAR